jgi:hypothetical protein
MSSGYAAQSQVWRAGPSCAMRLVNRLQDRLPFLTGKTDRHNQKITAVYKVDDRILRAWMDADGWAEPCPLCRHLVHGQQSFRVGFRKVQVTLSLSDRPSHGPVSPDISRSRCAAGVKRLQAGSSLFIQLAHAHLECLKDVTAEVRIMGEGQSCLRDLALACASRASDRMGGKKGSLRRTEAARLTLPSTRRCRRCDTGFLFGRPSAIANCKAVSTSCSSWRSTKVRMHVVPNSPLKLVEIGALRIPAAPSLASPEVDTFMLTLVKYPADR